MSRCRVSLAEERWEERWRTHLLFCPWQILNVVQLHPRQLGNVQCSPNPRVAPSGHTSPETVITTPPINSIHEITNHTSKSTAFIWWRFAPNNLVWCHLAFQQAFDLSPRAITYIVLLLYATFGMLWTCLPKKCRRQPEKCSVYVSTWISSA